jgi:chromosome segregation ATPase
VTDADLLRDLLELARREDLLQGESLEAFARALYERAALVLEERIRAVEEENAWRRESMAGLEERVRGLEAESAWQQETVAGLHQSVRSLEGERAWARETMAALQDAVRALSDEKASLEGERQKATRAHDDLLAHHRDVVGQVVREVLGVSSLSVLQLRQARRRLAALAELLRPEAK